MIHIILFNEIPHKNKENVSNESNPNRNFNETLLVADCSNDLLFPNEILKKFKGNISE